jgi:hypothetical protein
MDNLEPKGLGAGRKTTGYRQCPQCGNEMREIFHTRGQSGLFVWFECPRKGCSERRLLAMPAIAQRLMQKANVVMPRLRGNLVGLHC